ATSPLLSDASMRSLLLSDLITFERQLRNLYTGYDGYPDAAKMALLDMVYNLGAMKLRNEYPRMNAAVLAQDWATAAQQCNRQGINALRNQWTQQQFEEAAGGVAQV
ncbi:MAG: hypothetical protein KGK08_14590, partial [Acidobacteriota bacterium]|nr:hypothetical protein [Acidobacteriota bacterium]